MGYAQPDTVYSGPGQYAMTRPWSSYQEQLVSQALAGSQTPGEILRERTRPPLSQINFLPNRFGYGDPVDRTLTVRDVVNIEDRYNRYDFSGRTSGYESSSRPSLYG